MRKVKPYGMNDSEKHEPLFDPTKPVSICYWGMDGFGFALGFSQYVGSDRYFGGFFSPRIRVIEWNAGEIGFENKTKQKFNELFKQVYNVSPVLDNAPITSSYSDPTIPVRSFDK